jgi:uncharacterized membrane protein YjgN (DUF898 family)
MNTDAENQSPSVAAPGFAPERLRFTGTGSEYFGIWIVNLLLTIVTLGIYSAWAKVRRLQYFYRHTALAGSSFDFHGTAIRIFIGRAIALAMLLAYNFSVRLHSPLTFVVIIALAVVMPLLLRNSFRFRLYNTSWRGTRCHFRGSVGGSYRVFLLNGFLTLITLYIMAPFMHQRLKAYQHDNSWFGKTQCSFYARVGQFYQIYLLLLAAIIVFAAIIVSTGIGAAFSTLAEARQHGGPTNSRAVLTALLLLYGVVALLVVFVGPVFHALVTNLIWRNTRVGEHRIDCRLSPLVLVWITVSNVVLVALTVGLFTPWAAVRMAKYQVESVSLLPVSDLQEFVAADPENLGAVGEETATVFDFDIAL